MINDHGEMIIVCLYYDEINLNWTFKISQIIIYTYNYYVRISTIIEQ